MLNSEEPRKTLGDEKAGFSFNGKINLKDWASIGMLLWKPVVYWFATK